jgi:hypothetical protein
MPIFRRYAAFPAAIIPLALALFCGKGSDNPAAVEENGMLEIRARVVNKALAKSGAAAETAADSLVVEIGADDMTTITVKRKLDFTRPSVGDTLTKIPPGKNRRVKIWAIDKSGNKTHIDSLGNRTINIEDQKVASIHAVLIPAAGSIYLQFINLPSNCSAVYAKFASSDGTFIKENSVNKATRTFLNLDNIPHNAAGTLTVILKGAAGDTIKIAVKNMTFDAHSDNSIDLEFTDAGGRMTVDVAVYVPGVTVGSYNYGQNSESSAEETGELIITEIMWNATYENYVEVYNIHDDTLSFDTLVIDVNGTDNRFADVKIAPRGYFVFGRMALPYVDIHTPSNTGLAITNTGNWITVKNGRNGPVMDRVIFDAGTSNTTGWPSLSGSNKRSIELAKDKYNATDNNFGKNWKQASELISGKSDQYGTPGR